MTTSPLRDQWLTEDGPDEVTGHERSSTERVSFWKVFDGVIGQVAGEIQGGGGGFPMGRQHWRRTGWTPGRMLARINH
jgi:hypothetical protein